MTVNVGKLWERGHRKTSNVQPSSARLRRAGSPTRLRPGRAPPWRASNVELGDGVGRGREDIVESAPMGGGKRDRFQFANGKPALNRMFFFGRGLMGIDHERDAVVGERELGAMEALTRCRPAGQSGQNPHSAPAIFGLFEENAAAAQGKAMMLGANFQGGPRFFSGKKGRLGGSAERFYRAGLTVWPHPADKGAQFHESGIVSAGALAWQELRGGRPEPLAPGVRIDGSLHIQQAGEDTGDVRFDDGDRLVEGEGGDRIGCVAADSREITNRFRVSWECAAMFFHDGNGRGAKISGARIVAEPLPGVENVVFRSGGQRREIGESPEPLIIIRDDRGDLGLLEHKFRDEDRVGIGRVPPGKIAAIFAVPGKESAPE